MAKKEDLIIIIPGLKTMDSMPRLERKIIDFIGVMQPIYTDYTQKWKNGLKGRNKKVMVMNWSRTLGLSSFYSAKNKLLGIINKYHDKYNLKIVGLSLGGKIAFDAVKKLKGDEVKKMAIIAGVGMPDKTDKIKTPTLNIYANNDALAKLASNALTPLGKKLKIGGRNIKNIAVNLGHDGLCLGKIINMGKLKGKTIIKIIKSFLK